MQIGFVPSVVAFLLVAQGCGGGSPPGGPAAPQSDRAQAIRSHTCSKCHARPEAGEHTRAELEVIFGRHRSRARLTEQDWASMIDLLARADETHALR